MDGVYQILHLRTPITGKVGQKVLPQLARNLKKPLFDVDYPFTSMSINIRRFKRELTQRNLINVQRQERSNQEAKKVILDWL